MANNKKPNYTKSNNARARERAKRAGIKKTMEERRNKANVLEEEAMDDAIREAVEELEKTPEELSVEEMDRDIKKAINREETETGERPVISENPKIIKQDRL